MIDTILWTAGSIWVFYLCFIIFGAWHTAHLAGHKFLWTTYAMIVPPILIGYILDLIFNAIVGSLLFLEWPWDVPGEKEKGWKRWAFWSWTYTRRCRRHIGDDDWQGSIARWFQKLLNPFDAGHI